MCSSVTAAVRAKPVARRLNNSGASRGLVFAHDDVKSILRGINVFTEDKSNYYPPAEDHFVHRGEFDCLMFYVDDPS